MLLGVTTAAALFVALADARAAEPAPVTVTQQELEAWLAAEPEKPPTGSEPQETETLGYGERHRGVVIEGSVGALGHLGEMQTVSPVAPWFRLQAGYELLDWLMLFGQGDIALANTSFAPTPPDKRTYALYGFGAGARLSWQPLTALGFYLQADAGLSSVTQDVLATYGYHDADRLRPYWGSTAGIEWFQISPHYALAVYGGIRDYVETFERASSDKPPLAWLSGLAIRYAFRVR